jgi:type II secretory pathway component PulF
MNNQTMSLLPTQLFFSMGHLAAISSLLFIVIFILIVIFVLFFQKNLNGNYDERQSRSEIEPSITENRTLELSNFKQYSSNDYNPSLDLIRTDTNEEKIRSTTNLISSK